MAWGPSSREKIQAASVRATSRIAHCQESMKPAFAMTTMRQFFRFAAEEIRECQSEPSPSQWVNSSAMMRSGRMP